MAGASGAEVLAAIIAGYEVICRVALALPAGEHYARGSSDRDLRRLRRGGGGRRVFGLDADGVSAALGISSQASGSLQFLANGAWTKRFQVGWAAVKGLIAATLAREGFKGAAEAIEGKHGFLRAYAPNPNPERALQDLGTGWELMNTAVKPYPSCRYGHAGIDAALALRQARISGCPRSSPCASACQSPACCSSAPRTTRSKTRKTWWMASSADLS